MQDRIVPKREQLSRIWCPLTVQLHDDLVVSDENDRRHVNHAQGGRERLLVLGVQFDDLRQMSQSESETMPACGDETQTALDEPYKVRRLVFTLKKAASQSHTNNIQDSVVQNTALSDQGRVKPVTICSVLKQSKAPGTSRTGHYVRTLLQQDKEPRASYDVEACAEQAA